MQQFSALFNIPFRSYMLRPVQSNNNFFFSIYLNDFRWPGEGKLCSYSKDRKQRKENNYQKSAISAFKFCFFISLFSLFWPCGEWTHALSHEASCILSFILLFPVCPYWINNKEYLNQMQRSTNLSPGSQYSNHIWLMETAVLLFSYGSVHKIISIHSCSRKGEI